MSWRNGLTHIRCSECGRDLGWTSQAFVAKHPMPRCWNCRNQRMAVYGAAEERRELASAEATPSDGQVPGEPRPGRRVLAAIRRWAK